MEPLGVAANLIAVATAGIQLATTLYAFADKTLSADKRLRKISVDVRLTSSVLQQVGELLQHDAIRTACKPKTFEVASEVAVGCLGAFDNVSLAVGKSIKKQDDGTLELTKAGRFFWYFKEPNVELLRVDLDRLTNTLTLMLQVLDITRSLMNNTKLPEIVLPTMPAQPTTKISVPADQPMSTPSLFTMQQPSANMTPIRPAQNKDRELTQPPEKNNVWHSRLDACITETRRLLQHLESLKSTISDPDVPSSVALRKAHSSMTTSMEGLFLALGPADGPKTTPGVHTTSGARTPGLAINPSQRPAVSEPKARRSWYKMLSMLSIRRKDTGEQITGRIDMPGSQSPKLHLRENFVEEHGRRINLSASQSLKYYPDVIPLSVQDRLRFIDEAPTQNYVSRASSIRPKKSKFIMPLGPPSVTSTEDSHTPGVELEMVVNEDYMDMDDEYGGTGPEGVEEEIESEDYIPTLRHPEIADMDISDDVRLRLAEWTTVLDPVI